MSQARGQSPLSFVDLFAGCGGLSLGLAEAGLEPAFAVERSPMAALTYLANFHPESLTDASDQAGSLVQLDTPSAVTEAIESGVVVQDILRLVDLIENGDVNLPLPLDVVAGGPPCQGFSMAGRRDRFDPRNRLPLAFFEFVKFAKPRAVVMENVEGIHRAFRSAGGTQSTLDQLAIALGGVGDGYVVQKLHLNSRHFGVAQNRPRMMLIGIRADVAKELRLKTTEEVWNSGDEAHRRLADSKKLRYAVPKVYCRICGSDYIHDHLVWEAIADLATVEAGLSLSRSDVYRKAMSVGVDGAVRNHVLRQHSAHTVRRFALYRELSNRGIPASVVVEAARALDVGRAVADAAIRARLEYLGKTATLDGVLKSKLDAPDLVSAICDLATKKHSQRILDPQKPAPTVMTLPDDYVHPTEDRIMTVREMARFQSFPDSFVFLGKETTGGTKRRSEVPQYSQVGNAVPPLMARAIGELLCDLLA